MYDKNLYNNILSVECSFEELRQFNSQFGNKDNEGIFDLDNPFEKYYDVKKIIAAIEKYQKEEIDDRYLACWANAYNWIINGGFKMKCDEEISLKDTLIYEISDWLDSLSFFDGDEYYDLEKYKESFISLDTLFRDINDCKVIYASYGVEEYKGEKYEEITILVFNDKKKYFARIENDYGFNTKYRVELDYLKKYERQLIKDGYTKLKCHYECPYEE